MAFVESRLNGAIGPFQVARLRDVFHLDLMLVVRVAREVVDWCRLHGGGGFIRAVEASVASAEGRLTLMEGMGQGDGFDEDSACVICLGAMIRLQVGACSPCGHVYHCACWVEHLARSRNGGASTCPLCRLSVRRFVPLFF